MSYHSANKENQPLHLHSLATSTRFGTKTKSLQQSQVKRQLFTELEKKISTHFSGKSKALQELKLEMKNLADKYEEEILRNQQLSQEKEALQKENSMLGEIIDKLRAQIPVGSDRINFEMTKELTQKVATLTQEVAKYKRMETENENLLKEFDELKKERDFLYLNMERDRAAYEARIFELRESLAHANARIEERIIDDARSKHMFNSDVSKYNDQTDKWKKLYMAEAKNLLALQVQYKSLIEDNKCQTECILDLEAKLQKLDESYYALYNDYHKKLTEFRIEYLKEVQSEVERHKNSLNRSEYAKFENAVIVEAVQKELAREKERSQDLKTQISLLVSTKEELQRSLTVARHQAYELTLKLEEECKKLAALKDVKIRDLQLSSRID
mgnify:CR=1 FL=1